MRARSTPWHMAWEAGPDIRFRNTGPDQAIQSGSCAVARILHRFIEDRQQQVSSLLYSA